jgi:putative FmdB family regulatory protein
VPTYEYRCPNGHLFELFKSINAPSPEVCTICGEGPLEIVLHPVAVHFKGSGFYSTDYGKGNRRKSDASKDGGSDSGSGSGDKAEKTEKKESSVEKKAAEA